MEGGGGGQLPIVTASPSASFRESVHAPYFETNMYADMRAVVISM